MRSHLILLAALFVGCGTTTAVHEFDPADLEKAEESDEMVSRPFTTEDTTVWVFLRDKHDTDGDGVVSEEEYRRDHEAFVRLDRDRDGVLTADDFRRGDGMTAMVAQMTIMRYFQDDEDPRDLKLVELTVRFDAHDADGDGQLGREEFEAADVPQRPGTVRAMPPGMMPYASLLLVADTDTNGALSRQELVVFFEARDDDGDGVWRRRRRGRRQASRPTGAPEGLPAPDFTLHDPDGENRVRPVALIFGSYT
ncbi:MAG: EF-hand domain-containing protein [Planctomycetota bacterium]|jgi:Ca2+-binding EF-hand superfamily protein